MGMDSFEVKRCGLSFLTRLDFARLVRKVIASCI